MYSFDCLYTNTGMDEQYFEVMDYVLHTCFDSAKKDGKERIFLETYCLLT